MLFCIYGCLVVHEKCIFRKCFSVGLSTGVNWFPFLFYLQIPIFWKTERELRERETRPRAERERERERERGDDRFAIRLRLHRSTSNPFDFTFANPDSSSPIAISPSRQSRSQSQHRFVILDCSTPKPIVLDPKTDHPPSLLSSLNLIGLWFFFPGFYLCFWIEGWNYIFVWQVRKGEKMCFLCDFDFCCCGGVMVVFWWLWLLIASVCCRGLNFRVKNL